MKRVWTRDLGPKLWGSGPLPPGVIFRPLPASPRSKKKFPRVSGSKIPEKNVLERRPVEGANMEGCDYILFGTIV